MQQLTKRNSHSLLQFSTQMGAQHELQKGKITVRLLTANVNRTIKCILELLNHLSLLISTILMTNCKVYIEKNF